MAAKIEVMRKRQLAQALVEKTGGKLKYALAVVDSVFDEIALAVCRGTKVNVKDFGIFVKVHRKARIGRNPATKEPIKIKASVKPRFSASKALKEAVGGKKYAVHADEDVLKIGKIAVVKAAPAAARPAAKKALAPKKPAARKAPAKKTAKRK